MNTNFYNLRKAAEQGDAESQYFLGTAYASGDGVRQDQTETVKWWQKAAGQGYAKAQFSLGLAYAKGMGVAENPSAAVMWFRKAANQGDEQSHYFLGLAYASGKGVLPNLVEAMAWLHKGATINPNGDCEKMRAEVAKMITPQQYRDAMSMVTGWFLAKKARAIEAQDEIAAKIGAPLSEHYWNKFFMNEERIAASKRSGCLGMILLVIATGSMLATFLRHF
ncbi:MAG: tetratricopeptide repeat protein [Pseudomonadota bacterium]